MPRPKLPPEKHGVAKSVYIHGDNIKRLQTLVEECEETVSGLINDLIEDAYTQAYGEE